MNAITKNPTIAIALLLAGASLTSCKTDNRLPTQKPVKVNVVEIKQEIHAQELKYSGTIEPENTALVSFAVPGVIDKIMVEEGQYVKQGQVLAYIDDTEYRNGLVIAMAGLAQAEDLYARLSSLYQKGSLPAKDFIEIQTRVAQARANQEISSKHIKDSRLLAPMSGTVTKKMIEKGSVVSPGVPAFQIVKTDKVYARVAVPESEVGAVGRDMASGVFVKTLNGHFSGEVFTINPLADPVAKTYEVKVKLDNPEGRLLPGMIADVSILTGRDINIITVPARAVVRDADELSYVFVANEQNEATLKRVEVKGIVGANELIVSGLRIGDKVVVDGQSRLKEGSTLIATL